MSVQIKVFIIWARYTLMVTIQIHMHNFWHKQVGYSAWWVAQVGQSCTEWTTIPVFGAVYPQPGRPLHLGQGRYGSNYSQRGQMEADGSETLDLTLPTAMAFTLPRHPTSPCHRHHSPPTLSLTQFTTRYCHNSPPIHPATSKTHHPSTLPLP